jgi:hypothetical protein
MRLGTVVMNATKQLMQANTDSIATYVRTLPSARNATRKIRLTSTNSIELRSLKTPNHPRITKN